MQARRKDQVLDAAVDVLGTDGMRRLTYQAVDQRAGVPSGTTSNYFRSRDALLDGIVDHIEALDRADLGRLSLAADGLDGVALTLAGFVRHALGPGRPRVVARYALFLETLTRPELRDSLTRSREALVVRGGDWMRAIGSTEPTAHSRIVLDLLDGVILHQIAMPMPDFDPLPGIIAVLRGLGLGSV
ncbi:TetR/AcrR family transcriptional regulator [Kutzneria sp. NPDC052558]|uniref:TetR/AcrR family transcriptional regulator n=1 Tax=Kutzneria sp. NPDC052558 TaxID=3364121 RepID=UPI0037C5DE78